MLTRFDAVCNIKKNFNRLSYNEFQKKPKGECKRAKEWYDYAFSDSILV